jgi:hypothetical protein
MHNKFRGRDVHVASGAFHFGMILFEAAPAD